MSSKFLLSLVLGASWLAAGSAMAGSAIDSSEPAGKLIELHSCEVYAGGCVVSSQEPQGGRSMLQVWDLTGGAWQGVNLAGLKAAVLEVSSQNLADESARPDSAMVYLPSDATAAQQNALLAWLKSTDGRLGVSSIQTRAVPISVASSGVTVKVSLGRYASLTTSSLGVCKDRSCGEDLWYKPAAQTSRFTVALNESSQVDEPLLQLKWNDGGSRSVFVAHFGDSDRNYFVNSSDWCGLAGQLF
jgi:hypothetical protein